MNIIRQLNYAAARATPISNAIGYTAVSAKAAIEWMNLANCGIVDAAVPYWTIGKSIVDLTSHLTGLVERQHEHYLLNDSAFERVESLALDSANIYAAGQLLDKSVRFFTSTGNIFSVYNGLAISAAIQFFTSLYGALRKELNIVNECSYRNCTRDELYQYRSDLFTARDTYLKSAVASGVAYFGWTYFIAANPLGIAFLAAAAAYHWYNVPKGEKVNVFSFFHQNKMPVDEVKPKVISVVPAPTLK